MKKETVDLTNISEGELLKLRIKELPLSIEDTWLEACKEQLYKEFDAKGIAFKPPCYLADEWLTPDQEPVIGIPFYLAHPSLMKLEKKMMIEVEGGTKAWCMKLLRHEAGHAINYAYKLYKRRKWQNVFGRFSKEYDDTYRFRPYSRSFVKHLENYYAQYHPDEDFAETFAVWLTPNLDWQTQYKGWKALDKLTYIESLMAEIRDSAPLVKKGKQYWKASSLKITLRNYYKRKRHAYAEDFPDFHDANLKRIFVEKCKEGSKLPLAAEIIKHYRKNILHNVSMWTGEKKYSIDDLLITIIDRCKDLRLMCAVPEPLAVLRISTYVTALIMNYVHTGSFSREK